MLTDIEDALDFAENQPDAASWRDLHDLATRQQEALLRIANPGESDTVETLAEVAVGALTGGDHAS